jgi:cytochrome c5
MKRGATPLLTLLLAACSGAGAPPKPLSEAESATLAPADARLASLYEGSCKACHTVKDAKAPLTGDRTVWDARWAKGEGTLLASAIGGMGNMPAGGQCFECSPEDLAALIRFMAGREP